MKTPEEARKTWCPFARVAIIDPDTKKIRSSAFNRLIKVNEDPQITGIPSAATCIADECSQWVEAAEEHTIYEEQEIDRPKGETNPPFSNCPKGFECFSYGTGRTYKARKEIGIGPAKGFCGRNVGMALKVFGLAGKP